MGWGPASVIFGVNAAADWVGWPPVTALTVLVIALYPKLTTELTPVVSASTRRHGNGMVPRGGYADVWVVLLGARTRVAEGVRPRSFRLMFSSEREMCLLGKGLRS